MRMLLIACRWVIGYYGTEVPWIARLDTRAFQSMLKKLNLEKLHRATSIHVSRLLGVKTPQRPTLSRHAEALIPPCVCMLRLTLGCEGFCVQTANELCEFVS